MEKGKRLKVLLNGGEDTGWRVQTMDSEATSEQGRHHFLDVSVLPPAAVVFDLATEASDDARIALVKRHVPRSAVESVLSDVLGGVSHKIDWDDVAVAPQGGGYDIRVEWVSE